MTPSESDRVLSQCLTPREMQVLRLVADGLSNKEIATRLGCSPRTAAFHVGNLLHRLSAPSRAGLAAIHVRSSGTWRATESPEAD